MHAGAGDESLPTVPNPAKRETLRMDDEQAREMEDHFRRGLPCREFMEGAQENRELWHRVYRQARAPSDLLALARDLQSPWRLLALGEDWCMDSANTLPHLALLCEGVEALELRVLRKEENPGLMERHLTDGGEAIPVVMMLDGDFREVDWWGPRPRGLEDFFREELQGKPEEVRMVGLRGWYARDAGRSALGELLDRMSGVG